MLSDLKNWARSLRREVHAIYLATRRPDVPWYAKLLAMAVVGYALSPIDLIPEAVMVECRARATLAEQRPRGKWAAIVIVAIWLIGAAALTWLALAHWG